MASDWIPEEKKFTHRCPYCGEMAFTEGERNTSNTLKYVDDINGSDLICRHCSRRCMRGTTGFVIPLISFGVAALLSALFYLLFERELATLLAALFFGGSMASTIISFRMAPLRRRMDHLSTDSYILIKITKRPKRMWPRFRVGEIYEILPAEKYASGQVIAQMEKIKSNQLILRFIKSERLELQEGQQIVINSSKHTLEGIVLTPDQPHQ